MQTGKKIVEMCKRQGTKKTNTKLGTVEKYDHNGNLEAVYTSFYEYGRQKRVLWFKPGEIVIQTYVNVSAKLRGILNYYLDPRDISVIYSNATLYIEYPTPDGNHHFDDLTHPPFDATRIPY